MYSGDFGISRVLSSCSSLATTHCGTPCYYSPERCRGEQYGTAADVWGLGCVLFECLSLERAFNAENLRDLVAAVLDKPVPMHLVVGANALLRSAVEKMLVKDPASRATVNELITEFS